MVELTKYQELKMYMPINGYNSVEELADDWNCTPNAIRDNCRGKLTSKRLDELVSDFINEGDRKFMEHRNSKLTACHK